MTKYTLYRISAWLFIGAALSCLLLFKRVLVWVFGLPALILEPPQQAWSHALRTAVDEAGFWLLFGTVVLGVVNGLLQWRAARSGQPWAQQLVVLRRIGYGLVVLVFGQLFFFLILPHGPLG